MRVSGPLVAFSNSESLCVSAPRVAAHLLLPTLPIRRQRAHRCYCHTLPIRIRRACGARRAAMPLGLRRSGLKLPPEQLENDCSSALT